MNGGPELKTALALASLLAVLHAAPGPARALPEAPPGWTWHSGETMGFLYPRAWRLDDDMGPGGGNVYPPGNKAGFESGVVRIVLLKGEKARSKPERLDPNVSRIRSSPDTLWHAGPKKIPPSRNGCSMLIHDTSTEPGTYRVLTAMCFPRPGAEFHASMSLEPPGPGKESREDTRHRRILERMIGTIFFPDGKSEEPAVLPPVRDLDWGLVPAAAVSTGARRAGRTPRKRRRAGKSRRRRTGGAVSSPGRASTAPRGTPGVNKRRRAGVFVEIVHDGSLFPKAPILLVPEALKPGDVELLLEDARSDLETSRYDAAEAVPAARFFLELEGRRPRDRRRIRAERRLVENAFENPEIKAFALREASR